MKQHCSQVKINRDLYKLFQTSHLVFDKNSNKRLYKLKKYGSLLTPKVDVRHKKEVVIIIQEFFSSAVNLISAGKSNVFIDLPTQLNFIHNLGLIHGDIKLSNLAYDGNKFLIFDWEPTLFAIDGTGKLQFRTSKYSVHPQDFLNKRFTFKSDLKGMCLVLLQSKLGRAKGAKVAGKFSAKIDRLISKEHNPFIVAAKIKDLCNLDQSTQSEDIF